jgi:hypothetical protein
VRKMRRISGSFWTPERDERLRRLEAEGLSAAKIGEKLGTTRGAVLGRLHRLSGAALTYPSYIRQEKKARARAAARMKERKRVESTVIPRMQQEITRGVGRNRAMLADLGINQAGRSGRMPPHGNAISPFKPANATSCDPHHRCFNHYWVALSLRAVGHVWFAD